MGEANRRVLIINADDLGYSRGINQAIQQCFTAGMLRCATLMAAGAAFDHAVVMLRNQPGLDVGVHLVLTRLPAVAPPGKIAGLVDEAGCLPGSLSDLMAGIIRGRVSREALRVELAGQITKVLDRGLKPTHLDTHKHVHVMPQVLEVVIDLAVEFGIPWVRNPFDQTSFIRNVWLLDRDATATFCSQHAKARLLGACRSSFFKRLRGTGIRTPDHFFGASLTGIWNRRTVCRFLRDLPPGINEWMLHPGNCDEELRGLSTRLLEQREREKSLLIDPELQAYLAGEGIMLSSFREELI